MVFNKKHTIKNFVSHKPIVVLSGVNLTEGGPLSILQDSANAFVLHFLSHYRLILLVNNKNLLGENIKDYEVEILEYAYPKKSWFLRIWFEYVHSYFISKKIRPYLWFSLNDVTPNVHCANKIVYCQNPAPFYKLSFREAMIEKSLIFFNLFYGLFYRINIHSNKFVVVQQQWLKKEFEHRYKAKNIIVSYPDAEAHLSAIKEETLLKKFSFFYPSLPRVFKNFEILLAASEILERKHYDFEVILTFDGSENKYASQIIKKYGHLSSVKFIGIQKREELLKLYNDVSCLVFASKMETWGLPITEMKLFNKPMLLANCKYAHETAGNYEKVCFFDVDDEIYLSQLMKSLMEGTVVYENPQVPSSDRPFTTSWKALFSLLLEKEYNFELSKV